MRLLPTQHTHLPHQADFVASAPANVAATITPQHMLMNRNALFAKGLRPHNYCLPILKREKHREHLEAEGGREWREGGFPNASPN